MENHRLRIMIVEDDVPTSQLMAEVLRMHDYEAIVVNQSSKAIELAEATAPHAFLVDLMMPPPDGFRLCRMLRGNQLFKHTPILIVTALDTTDSKIVAIGAGATDYLVKPFQVDELISKVQDLLGE